MIGDWATMFVVMLGGSLSGELLRSRQARDHR